MAMPSHFPIGGGEEEVILNDRTTIRVRETLQRAVGAKLEVSSILETHPERFLEPDFLAVAQRLKDLVARVTFQEASLEAETRDPNAPGKIRWLEKGTQEECERTVSEFIGLLSPIVPGVTKEARGESTTSSGLRLPTLVREYKDLFGEGRWFEQVCLATVRSAVDGPQKREIIRTDVEILGRSGLWHETDILLVIADFSACFEAKSGHWHRRDVLKLLAQREDIGCDMGVLLTVAPPGEDFTPITRAHPLRVFDLAGDGRKAFVEWLSAEVRPR